MRHRKKGRILGRKKGARKALIRGLATSLVLYERIYTTEAKAKAVRPVVERFVTLSKRGDLHARRVLLSKLYKQQAVNKLLEVLGPRYKSRPGGYTRIIKHKQRWGDGAKMVYIEFVK